MRREESSYAEATCLNNHSDGVANGASAQTQQEQPHHQHGGATPGRSSKDITPQDYPVAATSSRIDVEKGVGAGNNGRDDDTIASRDEKDDFPEGGVKSWSVVVGAFCGSFAVFGIINSTAIFQEYFSAHQLSAYTSSQIGWIFGLSLFLIFFCGAPIGPIFDAYGPRLLIACGSVLLILSIMLLGICTRM